MVGGSGLREIESLMRWRFWWLRDWLRSGVDIDLLIGEVLRQWVVRAVLGDGGAGDVTVDFAVVDRVKRRSSWKVALTHGPKNAIKKIILGGPPAALVSLIGNTQYQRSAKDTFYFLQGILIFCLNHNLSLLEQNVMVLSTCYERHYNLTVPAPALSTHNPAPDLSISLYLPYAYLSVNNSSKILHNLTLPGFLTVFPHPLIPTKNGGVFKVDSGLKFQNEEWKYVYFNMSSFYSRVTGKVCMVGTGIDTSTKGNTLPLSAVIKLYYPITSSISNCIVRGTIESLDAPRSISHFDRVSIIEYFGNNYVFTKILQVMHTCLLADIRKSESFAFDSTDSCGHLESMSNMRFVLEYEREIMVRL